MHRYRHLSGATLLALIAASQPAAADIVYSNDFESGSTAGFSSGTIITAPNGQNFLGKFGPGNPSTTLTLTNLAPHDSVTVSFTLDVVGSMDGTGPVVQGGGAGDFFTITYSGSGSGSGTLFSNAFANYDGGNKQTYPVAGSAPATGAAAIDSLGYTGFPDSGNGIQDTVYNFVQPAFTDTAGTLALTFTSFSNENFDNEFYGFDNVVVSTALSAVTPPASGSTVPEPSPLLLMGIAGLGMALSKRRRR